MSAGNTILLITMVLCFILGQHDSTFAQQTQQWQIKNLGSENLAPVRRVAKKAAIQVTEEAAEGQTAVVRSADAEAGVTRVTNGLDVLPNTAGQVWRTYDISPYTSRVTNHNKPQQAVIDWILRETGTEMWFSEPLGILSASPSSLRVYHTPETQEKVQQIVDRLVSSRAKPEVFSMRLITLSSANWRARAFPALKDIEVKSSGVEAWLMSKENAAILLGELRKRADFQLHNSPDVAIHNGQPFVTSRTRPLSYPQTLVQRNPRYAFYDLKLGSVDEGYTLEMSPLRSLDGDVMEAVIKCSVDQVEKFEDVEIEVPTPTGQSQSVTIQVPQVVSWRVVERFRWPANQVLLLSCGVVASPGVRPNQLIKVPKLLNKAADRADALLFIESKGTIDKAVLPSTAGLMTTTPPTR